jgi:hypothetical protein
MRKQTRLAIAGKQLFLRGYQNLRIEDIVAVCKTFLEFWRGYFHKLIPAPGASREQRSGMQVRLLSDRRKRQDFPLPGEARRELLHPAGPLLLFVAPKQTTFQLERQHSPTPPAWVYVAANPFVRPAGLFPFRTIWENASRSAGGRGRVMVLRALWLHEQLKVFRAVPD